MLVRYTVDWWDEVNCEPATESGVTTGESLGMAVDKVVDYYGQENVVSIKVYECEEVIPDGDLQDFLEDAE